MTLIDAITSAHRCLSNDLPRLFSDSICFLSSVAELSPEAIKKLEDSRNGWQIVRNSDFSHLLFATKMVAIGVILEGPELVYELINAIKRWRKRKTREYAPSWITFIGLIGWVAVSIGVAGEFWIDSKVNSEDENIQSINIALLRDADSSAVQAKNDASAAQVLARGARKEADSFEGKIVSAKKQAGEAEQKLAVALKDAEQAQEALNRIRVPRSLEITPEVTSALEGFKGTKYVFVGVNADDEAINLLKAIDKALKASGWVRDKSVGGFPAINPDRTTEPDFSVPAALEEGVSLSVESPDAIESLQRRPVSLLARHIQAAIVLRQILASAISPAAGHSVSQQVHVDKGSGETIKIMVGRKPLD